MEPRKEEPKKKRFRIVKLEERVVPSTISPVPVPAGFTQVTCSAATGGGS